jgi:hypothetical protein
MYIKYHDISRRHFYWTIWEKKRGTYSSYSEFKKDRDSNISIWQEIKDKLNVNIKGDVERLLKDKDPFGNRQLNNDIKNILESNRKRK